MPVSRFLIPLVSTVWIFSVMGDGNACIGRATHRSTGGKATVFNIGGSDRCPSPGGGSTVRFLPGRERKSRVRYADTTAEALYEIQVENGTLVVKIKAPPRKLSPSTERLCSLRWTAPMTWRLSCPSVSISRSL